MISSNAIVQTDRIGEDVEIAEFSIVRAGAVLGRGVRLHPHVIIESGVQLGDGVEVFSHAVIGKAPRRTAAVSRSVSFERKVVIGERASIGPHAVLYYDVEIGADTLIGDGASIREQCRIGDRCIISRHVTMNYNSRVGNDTKIMDLAHVTGNCTIGEHVFVSTLVATVNDNAMGQDGYQAGSIVGPTIQDRAMIGAGAVLLPGVVIGRGAIVGSGSVVTKNVAPGTLVMGTPARFVRHVGNSAET